MVWQARPQPQPTPAGPDTTQTGPCFPNIARGRVRRRIAPTDAGRPTAPARRGATAYVETGRAGPTINCPSPASSNISAFLIH